MFIYQRIKTPLFILVLFQKVFRFEYFVKTLQKVIPKSRHYLKMFAIPSNCSLYELQTRCGSSTDKESLLSESNSNISAHMASCYLSKCGGTDQRSRADFGKRAGLRGSSATQFASLPICPSFIPGIYYK